MLFFIYMAEKNFLNDPELQDEIPNEYLSHKEMYENAIRKSTIILRKIRKLKGEGMGGIDNDG